MWIEFEFVVIEFVKCFIKMDKDQLMYEEVDINVENEEDVVVLRLEFTLCWHHEIHIHMSFCWVLCKHSRCYNVLLCLLNYMWIHECDERMNGEPMML